MDAVTENPAFASQAGFRALMDAIARPGEIRTLRGPEAPAPLAVATAALAQSLCDFETPLWLDHTLATPAVVDWLRFRTGAPIVTDKRAAGFAFITDVEAMPDLTEFALGSEEYPDRSTTLIIQIERFGGETVNISGPGIKTTRAFAATPLPVDFAGRMAANRELFPRGVDLVFVAGTQIAALPRSIRIARGL